MSSIVVSGDTSGAVTLAAPAVAGTTTITLPNTSGTMVTGTVGTAANNIVALNSSAQLPAVDGSLLTNVTAAPPVLLANVVTTSGNSVSASNLSLSPYRQLQFSFYSVSSNSTNSNDDLTISNNNTQTLNSMSTGIGGSSTSNGTFLYDLSTKVYVGSVTTGSTANTVTTATTTIYFRMSGTFTFDSGYILIYGVK